LQLVQATEVMGYVGQCRGAKMIAHCNAKGLGEMTQPQEFPPRRYPWALDNGAFALWKSGKPFDGERFARVCEQARALDVPPDFVVVPDVVAGGLESLALSLRWADCIEHYGFRLALVVQDGMTPEDVAPFIERFAVVFVGGSLDWKLDTMKLWADFAHEHGCECHVGRLGTANRIRSAKRAGVDSVDSCTPLWSEGNMARYTGAIEGPAQGFLWGHLERKAKTLSEVTGSAKAQVEMEQL
jgi:hypothetical protein